jgi:amino acid transporter
MTSMQQHLQSTADARTIHVSTHPDASVEQFGYKQQFDRTLRAFSSFAVGFSFISITSGIFTTFAFLLATSGPRGLWMWIPAAIGQLLITLIYAHFAARIPLAGFSYQWASRLAGPKVGWIFGWLSYAFLAVVVVATNYGFVTQALMPLLHIAPSLHVAEALTIAVAAIEAGVIIFSTKLAARINAAAVVTEIIGVAGLTIVLLVVALAGGKGDVSILTSTGVVAGGPGYYGFNGPFMLAVLLGAYTIVGFESIANLAEETENPTKVVPRAMIRATTASGALGLLFLIALCVAMPNVTEISNSSTPITDIMQARLGSVVSTIFLVIFVISLFANSLVIMMSGSRMVFAMARDKRFPASRLFSTVVRRTDSPIAATLLIFAGLVVIMLGVGNQTTALSNLFTAATILPAIIYLATVVLFAVTRNKLPEGDGVFTLGRIAPFVIGASLVWLAFELSALLLPDNFRTAVVIAAVVLGVGIVVFVGYLVFAPKALSEEPGGVLNDVAPATPT